MNEITASPNASNTSNTLNASGPRECAYTFTSTVLHGHGLGHKLGFATVNQVPPPSFSALERGVWFSECEIDGAIFPAVSNLGVKPTVVDGGELLCETHILGCDRDLYGCTIKTTLIRFSRPERRFDSVSSLAEALAADVAAAKAFFGLR